MLQEWAMFQVKEGMFERACMMSLPAAWGEVRIQPVAGRFESHAHVTHTEGRLIASTTPTVPVLQSQSCTVVGGGGRG